MKKKYLILYKSNHGTSLSNVKLTIMSIGNVTNLIESSKAYTCIVESSDESMTAFQVRSKISEVMAPFDDGLLVSQIGFNDSSSFGTLANIDNDEENNQTGSVKRNFSRFQTKHEAYEVFKLEQPRWCYDDGINMAINVDFNEWCWLPVRKDGIYMHGKYDKYLR